MRKAPTQARAKERVARILDATDALIIKHGVTGFSVNEIAAHADVAIGSLYQYFANKDEVVRALCIRYYDLLQATTAENFGDAHSITDFIRELRRVLVACWNFTQNNEGYRRLFFDIQAWEIVHEVALSNNLLNAGLMQAALSRFMPHISPKRLMALCVITGDAAGGAARLAARFDDLDLFSEFLDMAESRLYALLQENSVIERGTSSAMVALRARTHVNGPVFGLHVNGNAPPA